MKYTVVLEIYHNRKMYYKMTFTDNVISMYNADAMGNALYLIDEMKVKDKNSITNTELKQIEMFWTKHLQG